MLVGVYQREGDIEKAIHTQLWHRRANSSQSIRKGEKTKIAKPWYMEKTWHRKPSHSLEMIYHLLRPSDEHLYILGKQLPYSTPHCSHHHHHHTLVITISMVMWSHEVPYFNVLKFLITLTSASAVAPSSPIPVHW